MGNIELTAIQGGMYVATALIGIAEIPAAHSVHENIEHVRRQISGVFSEIVGAISMGNVNQDTAIELLCVSTPVTGQAYAAGVLPYLILRKCGKDKEALTASLEAAQQHYLASLSSVSYVASAQAFNSNAFQSALNGISDGIMLSIEKKLHSAFLPTQMVRVCYTDMLPEQAVLFSPRLFEALSTHPNCAVSLQLIPFAFVPEEHYFVQQICYAMNSHGPGHDIMPVSVSLREYYEHMLKHMDEKHFLFSVLVHGDKYGASDIAGVCKAAIQGSDGQIEVAVKEYSPREASYRNEFPFFPWNMMLRIVSASSESVPPPFRRFMHALSLSESCSLFCLPFDDGQTVGIAVNEAKRVRDTFADKVFHKDNIRLGHLVGASKETALFGAPLQEFTRHALLVGIPGTGKTTCAINLLMQFYKRGIPFLAIEPTKNEYRAMIDAIPELQVFTPGKNHVVPFLINPFLPPDGISLETFKPSLLSAFRAAFSMPNPLDILFANAVDACYTTYGWRNYSKAGDEGTRVFGLYEFIIKFREIIRNSGYSSEVKGNMESAGVFRLLNLIVQNENIYDTIQSVSLQDLLRSPTVIELNAIDNEEQKALIMALMLIQIVLYTKNLQAGDGKLKNIIMIDEAHVLLGNSSNTAAQGGAESSSTAAKALQNMIVEIRSYGTGMIIADQSPRKVTREIVGNTGVKIVFQLLEAEDRNMIAASSNLSETDRNQLGLMKTGEAFVFYRGLPAPQRVLTEDIRSNAGIRLSVSDEEVHNRSAYWQDKQHLLKPYAACEYCNVCRECDFRLRADANFFAEQMLLRDKHKMNDKKALFSQAVYLGKRLRAMCEEIPLSRFTQLLYCTTIRYIRKAALQTNIILTDSETKRVLEACLARETEFDV